MVPKSKSLPVATDTAFAYQRYTSNEKRLSADKAFICNNLILQEFLPDYIKISQVQSLGLWGLLYKLYPQF
jgi:hypothetical protein